MSYDQIEIDVIRWAEGHHRAGKCFEVPTICPE